MCYACSHKLWLTYSIIKLVLGKIPPEFLDSHSMARRQIQYFYIFLLSKGYIAPAKIDPKFLDPKYIFSEVEPEGKKTVSLSKLQVIDRELKQVTFLSHGRKLEVNIWHARIVISPRFSN